MKIVIVSDIHDNLVNLDKCLSWCKKQNIESIICCGDIANSETLEKFSAGFSGKIYLVKGNMEIYDEDELKRHKNIKYFGQIGNFTLNKIKIGACHEPFLIDKVIESGDKDIIFYGHTHKPWIDQRQTRGGRKIKVVNPGTLGGVFQKATFAFWDINNQQLELKILEKL